MDEVRAIELVLIASGVAALTTPVVIRFAKGLEFTSWAFLLLASALKRDRTRIHLAKPMGCNPWALPRFRGTFQPPPSSEV